jgi:hypothetical protein
LGSEPSTSKGKHNDLHCSLEFSLKYSPITNRINC